MTKQLLSQDVKNQFDAIRDLLGAALALAEKSSGTGLRTCSLPLYL